MNLVNWHYIHEFIKELHISNFLCLVDRKYYPGERNQVLEVLLNFLTFILTYFIVRHQKTKHCSKIPTVLL